MSKFRFHRPRSIPISGKWENDCAHFTPIVSKRVEEMQSENGTRETNERNGMVPRIQRATKFQRKKEKRRAVHGCLLLHGHRSEMWWECMVARRYPSNVVARALNESLKGHNVAIGDPESQAGQAGQASQAPPGIGVSRRRGDGAGHRQPTHSPIPPVSLFPLFFIFLSSFEVRQLGLGNADMRPTKGTSRNSQRRNRHHHVLQ